MEYIILFAAGYLLGSFPTAYLVVKKVLGRDIRTIETGNVGAMNTARATGKFYLFFVVFLVDALKGYLAVLIAQQAAVFIGSDVRYGVIIAAFGAVLGHCYSLYFKLKDGKFAGGKAVSSMAGILFGVSFLNLLVPICIVMLLVVALTRNFFASQFFGAVFLPLITMIFLPEYTLLAVLCVIPILIKQSPRVIPYFEGKEPKLYFKQKAAIKS